jgi:hypothetical protein
MQTKTTAVPAHYLRCPQHPEADAHYQGDLSDGRPGAYFCAGPGGTRGYPYCGVSLPPVSAGALVGRMRHYGAPATRREAVAILAAEYRSQGRSYPRERATVDLADALAGLGGRS